MTHLIRTRVGFKLLATGQTTPYSSEEDDGYHEKGKAKGYTVLSTGGYSGTSNIDLAHRTSAGISFDSATKEIREAGECGIFNTAGTQTIVISGSGSNDGVYTTTAGTDGDKIVVNEAISDEAAGATVTIAVREAHSNNCVQDLATGLMWSRYTSATYATMGAASDGKMVWTGELYDIFAYCAAANAASLGGHADWRVPNVYELFFLMNLEATDAKPDAVAFPGWPAGDVFTSTTRPNDVTKALIVSSVTGLCESGLKTSARLCTLVRGG